YHEAVVLDVDGYVSEGSGQNIFLVQDGVLCTPSVGDSILAGITRDLVIELARERGYTVVEQRIARERLYTADEVFFTGTATEITPVRSVDGRSVGNGARGPVTAALQAAFFDLVTGRSADPRGWLTPVQAEP